jgi:hypothetical protein
MFTGLMPGVVRRLIWWIFKVFKKAVQNAKTMQKTCLDCRLDGHLDGQKCEKK